MRPKGFTRALSAAGIVALAATALAQRGGGFGGFGGFGGGSGAPIEPNAPFDGFRGGFDWNNFEQQLQRVLSEGRFVELDASKTIFHSFFEIDNLDIVPQYYDRGAPSFRAIFEDNDPNKRMMGTVNSNPEPS